MHKPASTPPSPVQHLSRCYRNAPRGSSLEKRFAHLSWLGYGHVLCGVPPPLAAESRPAQRRHGHHIERLEPCVHIDIYYSDRY
ncbi:hypothetical protein GMST_14640 [Geomonas silvestris]|uniref:Uncharacterized protein n=1 Tax=Geomonas silvestris TaxID=2740184 RepID=A0A6V8MHJ2_9BACT|nr:hypothetical protein GMST_14640 [Geomonas silvestris]